MNPQMGNQNINPIQMMQNNPQTKAMMDAQARMNQMLGGKTPEEQEQIVRNAYKNSGVDIDQAMKQLFPQMQGQGNQQMQNNQMR